MAMDNGRPMVQNAADPGQVKDAKRKERHQRDRELSDLVVVLATEEGRRFVWRLLEHCGAFASVWHPSAMIHYNSGKQDVGHFLLAELTEAQPNALVDMMTAARKEREV